jgi:hypothetical protein
VEPAPASRHSRYPGAQPFGDSEVDRRLFFGRDREVDELTNLIVATNLLVLFSKSGLGKTSLLQAGVFPRLREQAMLPLLIRLNQPDRPLMEDFLTDIAEQCRAQNIDHTPGANGSLWEYFKSSAFWRNGELLTPVLVIDQAEEVFTLHSPQAHRQVAEELGQLLRSGLPTAVRTRREQGASLPYSEKPPNVKVVLSLREDYLGYLQELTADLPQVLDKRFRLGALTRSAAERAVVEPAALPQGDQFATPAFQYQAEAVAEILDFLMSKEGEIEPFQLQVLCQHVERKVAGTSASGVGNISIGRGYLGGPSGMDGILQDFYRNTIRHVPDRRQRGCASRLCDEGLLSESGRRLSLEESQIIRRYKVTPATLNHLVDARLLRKEPRLHSFYYEISHDSLAPAIVKSRPWRMPRRVTRALKWSGAALVALVVGLTIWNGTVEAERRKAEQLLSFMLGERFLGEVRDLGRTAMMEQVQLQTVLADQGGALLGLSLRNAGDITRTEGHLAESVGLFEQALTAIENTVDSPDRRREAARTHDRLSQALADQGFVSRALEQQNTATGEWRQVLASTAVASPEDCTSLADSLVTAADLKYRKGEVTLALADQQEAVKVVSAVLFGPQADASECAVDATTSGPYPDPKALTILTRAALLRGEVFNDQDDYETAATLARKAQWLRPPSISTRQNALTALAYRGNSRSYESPQRALDDHRSVLAEFEELRRWDPANMLWQRERSAVQLLVIDGSVACHEPDLKTPCDPKPSLEDAWAAALETSAALRSLSAIDPTNVSLQFDISWAMATRAKISGAMQRWPERLALIEEAERTRSSALHDQTMALRDPTDAQSLWELANVRMEKSDALTKLGRAKDATQALQQAIEIFEGLATAHADNANFVWWLGEARGREADMVRAADPGRADLGDQEEERLKGEYSRLLEPSSKHADEIYSRAVDSHNKGSALHEKGDPEAALAEFKAAEPLYREYLQLRPGDARAYEGIADANTWIEFVLNETAKAAERRAPLRAAMHAAQIAAWLASEKSLQKGQDRNDALLKARHALALYLYDDLAAYGDVSPMMQENIAVAESLLRNEPAKAAYQWYVGISQCVLGMARHEAKMAGWREALQSGAIYIDKAIASASDDQEKKTFLEGKAQCEDFLKEPEAGLASDCS